MGLGIEIGLESGSGLEGAPRASRRREGGEVRARANLDFRARRPPLPHRATGGLRQRPGGTPARVLVPNAAVRSGGAIGVGRAAAAWQQAAKRRAATNLHLVVDSRGGCAPAARHGLGIRHELASDAASGRIGAPLTRSTVRGLAVVWSSPHAAGRNFFRAARRSGTSWRRPSPTGYSPAAGAFGAL